MLLLLHSPSTLLQARLRTVERELKQLAAQQKALAAKKQVNGWALGVPLLGRFTAFGWLGAGAGLGGRPRVQPASAPALQSPVCHPPTHRATNPPYTRPPAPQELAGEKEAAQRRAAGAELDVADLQDKLQGNAGGWRGWMSGWLGAWASRQQNERTVQLCAS